ncbi:hypothetical protein J6590_004098 [Homalodisca vitripennis]|nr:hypothetical protein J6590_004098 [Homalodisca vitripennis]
MLKFRPSYFGHWEGHFVNAPKSLLPTDGRMITLEGEFVLPDAAYSVTSEKEPRDVRRYICRRVYDSQCKIQYHLHYLLLLHPFDGGPSSMPALNVLPCTAPHTCLTHKSGEHIDLPTMQEVESLASLGVHSGVLFIFRLS